MLTRVAELTPGIMVLLGVTTLTISLLGAKPYAHLQLVPHITKYHQASVLLLSTSSVPSITKS